MYAPSSNPARVSHAYSQARTSRDEARRILVLSLRARLESLNFGISSSNSRSSSSIADEDYCYYTGAAGKRLVRLLVDTLSSPPPSPNLARVVPHRPFFFLHARSSSHGCLRRFLHTSSARSAGIQQQTLTHSSSSSVLAPFFASS
ncbi:hypothetical protein MRX96_007393 [Rhipicephalus microplus]